jgi:Cobalamin-independent synthase, Catalytic domain
MVLPLLPTSLVGSYAQPEWLIDRKKLASRFPPRVRAWELWRVGPEFLEQAQDDATVIAIRDQERAGLDIITDGEMRRESYSNRFATALDGIDIDDPGTALDRSGHPNPVPRIVGKIRRKHPVEVRNVEFLRANTDRTIKITVPGPFTMAQQAQNDFYKHEEELVLDYAAAVNAEVKDLFAAGADVVQLDEPYMQARPENSTMHWHLWVVLIDGSAGAALRVVRPPNLHITPMSARSRSRRKCDGFFAAITFSHHGPRHSAILLASAIAATLVAAAPPQQTFTAKRGPAATRNRRLSASSKGRKVARLARVREHPMYPNCTITMRGNDFRERQGEKEAEQRDYRR